jgi:hypothetical protein
VEAKKRRRMLSYAASELKKWKTHAFRDRIIEH